MKKFLIISLISFFACLVSFEGAIAQTHRTHERPAQTTRILFVFDASLSMYGRWDGEPKITIARRLMHDLLDSLRHTENLQMALRVYGHQHQFPPQVCDDTRLEVPFGRDNVDRLKHKIQTIVPRGTTPIALSLERSADDFPPCADCRNIIILVTDGIEECGGDPCEVSLRLQQQGIVLKPFVIGVGDGMRDAFECVGTYFDARDQEEFRYALNVAIHKALNPTTAQVNLLDIEGYPVETDVNMTFYNKMTGEIMHNLIHTINARGFPDTLDLDPLVDYRMDVHTIPPVSVDSFGLSIGKHNVVGVDAPQGYLQVVFQGRGHRDHFVNSIVRKNEEMATLNVQEIGKKERYLVGSYDLEILTRPRIYVEGIRVRQSHTTTVEIPTPGLVMMRMGTHGYGSIYKREGNDSLTWVYNLPEDQQQKSLFLLPGHYKVVFRARSIMQARYTREVDFEVQPGRAITVNIYN